MNLKTEYMENAYNNGRKIFRRQWGTDKHKPLWIKLDKNRIMTNNGKQFILTEEDRNANDWCIYGASESERKMFLNELTWDDIFYLIGRRYSA